MSVTLPVSNVMKWLKAVAFRNIDAMSVTLLVSQLIGWLNSVAPFWDGRGSNVRPSIQRRKRQGTRPVFDPRWTHQLRAVSTSSERDGLFDGGREPQSTAGR